MKSLRWPINADGGPMVVMEPEDSDPIILPIPSNLNWTDSHSFSTIDISSTTAGKVTSLSELSGAISGSGKAKELIMENSKGLAAGGAFGDNLAALGMKKGQKGRKTLNPQTRTLYKSSNLRTFPFEFLLIPRSEQETKVISEIHKKLRELSYPKADLSTANLIIDFPTTWEISFENVKDFPEIKTCFLTELSTTFNPSASIWRVDGTPVEIAISLSFTETRPYFDKTGE